MSYIVLLIAGGIFSLLGGAFIGIITIIKKYNDELYARCISSTEGIVDGVWEHYSGPDCNDMRSYYPIYKYIVNGNEYRCRGVKGTYSPNKIKNEKQKVYYNPNNPSESYVDRSTADGIIKLFKILGIIFLSIGIVLIILHFIFNI